MKVAVANENDDVVRFSLRTDNDGDVKLSATRGGETVVLGYFQADGVLLLTNTEAEKKKEFGFSVRDTGEIETR